MAWQQIREMFAEKDLNISRSSICFTEKRTRPRFRVTASELLPNNQAHFVKTSPCRPAFCNLIILNPLVGAGKKNNRDFKGFFRYRCLPYTLQSYGERFSIINDVSVSKWEIIWISLEIVEGKICSLLFQDVCDTVTGV